MDKVGHCAPLTGLLVCEAIAELLARRMQISTAVILAFRKVWLSGGWPKDLAQEAGGQ